MTQSDPLFDPSKQDQEINQELQNKMNKPPVDPQGFNPDDEAFLQEIIAKVESETINVYSPSSLYNEELVESLDQETQARIEITAQSLLAHIRNIVSLWEYEKQPTYQIKNLIHQLRVTKERFELEEGDVFII